MPAADRQRGSSVAPLVLLWAGVAVAASAAGLLIVGATGGLVRAGAVLAMVAVIFVALGAILSRTGGPAEPHGDRDVTAELEALREDLRADINHAAKASHRVLSERIVALADTVDALRGQIEVLRAHVERNHLVPPTHPAAPGNHGATYDGVTDDGVTNDGATDNWTPGGPDDQPTLVTLGPAYRGTEYGRPQTPRTVAPRTRVPENSPRHTSDAQQQWR